MTDIDDLAIYLSAIGQYPILSRAQEQTADVETLVNHNLRLVVNVAKSYRGRGMDFFDLIQEGNIGLMRAAQKFNPARGTKFSTMAVPWIIQGIDRALLNSARLIRLPVHVSDAIRKLNKAREQVGYDATVEQIAACCGWGLEKTQRTIDAVLSAPYSLDAVVVAEHDSKERTLGSFIAAPATDYIDPIVSDELAHALDCAMHILDEREIDILRKRYHDGLTLDQAGATYGVTRERARQIESAALKKPRTTDSNLRIFLEA